MQRVWSTAKCKETAAPRESRAKTKARTAFETRNFHLSLPKAVIIALVS